MPIAIILIVGIIVYNNGLIDKVKNSSQETSSEVVASKAEVKITTKEAKPILKQPEPIKEEVQTEGSESNYLKIILYIIGAIATIFGGFYFFSSRGNNQASISTADNARKDIEESYQPEIQEQQPTPDETQSDTQEQQPTPDETQSDTQEQQPAQEENQPETQEQQTTEDENNNK